MNASPVILHSDFSLMSPKEKCFYYGRTVYSYLPLLPSEQAQPGRPPTSPLGITEVSDTH